MDCKKAGQYMMEYMENNISSKHLYDLKIHIKNCESCKNEFELYESFRGMEDDCSKAFDSGNIMSRVRDSNSLKIVPKDFNRVSYLFFLVISLFFGTIFFLLGFFEPLSQFFTNQGLFIPQRILELLNICVQYISLAFSFLYVLTTKLNYYIKILLLIFVICGVLVYFIKKK